MSELDPRAYWVGFNLVKGIGSVRFKALLSHFGDPAAAWAAPAGELRQVGLPARIVEALIGLRSEIDLEQVWDRIQHSKVTVLTWDDPAYPRLLNEIDQPPPVLYVLGQLDPRDDWAAAVVGTRRVTAYGRQVTAELAGALARGGATVVSGLARGVDGIAHQAALDAGGRTLAVLGSGVDAIYPPEHRRLAEAIAHSGAIISDYPLGTKPDAANFPPRNRIVSGLSRAVVVVEAGQTSGALITASFAADQGREVYAVPGPIYSPQSKGTNALLRQGAQPLLDFNDLLAALNLEQAHHQQAARTALPGDATEAQLYSLLSREPLHVDELRAQANLPVEKVSAALALMELKGLVRQVGGMQYIALRDEGGEYTTS
jgi:DNA processing protein